MKSLSGIPIAKEIRSRVAEKIERLKLRPRLAVLLIGENSASVTYVGAKRRACGEVGIDSLLCAFDKEVEEREVLKEIEKLNQDRSIHGILLQLPLPPHLSQEKLQSAIDPRKDVDGLHPINMGKLLLGHEGGFIPCTPLGIKTLLEWYEIPVLGKEVVIVGRSNIVGKPLAALLMQKREGCNATVTIAHQKTKDLVQVTQRADILVAAIGVPAFIQPNMVKREAVVIDVGINRVNGHLVGDVDPKIVCQALSPVPKGIGPMTVAMLLYNTVSACENT